MTDALLQNPSSAPTSKADLEELGGSALPRTCLDELIQIVLRDTTIKTQDKVTLIRHLRALKPPQEDRLIYRIVVFFLGIAALGIMIASIVLLTQEQQLPDGLLAMGSAALGALAGILVPITKGSSA